MLKGIYSFTSFLQEHHPAQRSLKAPKELQGSLASHTGITAQNMSLLLKDPCTYSSLPLLP